MKEFMKTLSPRKATTEKKLCSLRRDNTDFSQFNILISEDEIFLSDQKSGEGPKQSFALPRKDFNRIIDWYNKEQVTRIK